jgi:uncharacterized protein YutE (UPF0331/DUF86 family)
MERILQKIGRIREHLHLLKTLRPECHERFSSDPIYRGALLHYLYLLADGCIVLAEQVIKIKKLRLPQSYAEAFDILGERGILPTEFAFSFATIAGFRNFLAHDYEKIDEFIICADVMKRLEDVERYLQLIEEKLLT